MILCTYLWLFMCTSMQNAIVANTDVATLYRMAGKFDREFNLTV